MPASRVKTIASPACTALSWLVDKLAEIIAWKRLEVADRVRPVSNQELAQAASQIEHRGPSFKANLTQPGHLSVIAEVKRSSPSAGSIRADIDAA